MFFFGRRGRFFLAARIGLLVALLVALFVFHAHGETLRILQGARIILLIALLLSGMLFRRRRI
jgi:uncharacterized membrane protein